MAARTLMHAQPAGSPRLGHVPTGEPRASCWQGAEWARRAASRYRTGRSTTPRGISVNPRGPALARQRRRPGPGEGGIAWPRLGGTAGRYSPVPGWSVNRALRAS
jgi:hypothetical protein